MASNGQLNPIFDVFDEDDLPDEELSLFATSTLPDGANEYTSLAHIIQRSTGPFGALPGKILTLNSCVTASPMTVSPQLSALPLSSSLKWPLSS